MKNKINPYRRNAEVLKDFFRQPLSLVISIALTLSFLTQTLLSIYSFLNTNKILPSFISIIYVLPICGFLSLFIKAYKNRNDFSPRVGLTLLSIYSVISIVTLLTIIAIQITLYILKPDVFMQLFNLQTADIIGSTALCVSVVLIIPTIFSFASLVLVNSIRKGFSSIYLFKGGSVTYSIFAMISALFCLSLLVIHFNSSSDEYRSSVYFFLTAAVLIFEFITYLLYTIFGFSYNSYIKKITLGITDSKSDINLFTNPPKNENYRPLNMWDDTDDKMQKNDSFSPQTVFDTTDTTDEAEIIPGEFDMWNEPEEEYEAPKSVVTPEIPTAVLTESTTAETSNNAESTQPDIDPDPVFTSANTTETKHNKFEKWNDEVKSKLEKFDNEYQAQKNTRIESQTKNIPVDFPIPDTTFTENHTPTEKYTTIQTPEFNHTNKKPTYEPVITQVTPDIQVGAEFIPQQSKTKRTASTPENEDFASVELWDKPIMPMGKKSTSTPPVIIDTPSTPISQKQPNNDGNEYIYSLWGTPIMNYGSDRPLRNSNKNPYVIPSAPGEKSKKTSRKEKRNKRNNAQQQYPQYPQYPQQQQYPQHQQNSQYPQHPQQAQRPQQPQQPQQSQQLQQPKYPQQTQQSPSQPVICPNCKSMCNDDVYFCIKCGTILK